MFLILLSFKLNEHEKEKLIIGKWYGFKKETKAGRGTLNNGSKMEEYGKYEFFKDGKVIDLSNSQFPETTFYKFKENNLIQMGKRTFKIEKITNNTLILLDFDDTDPEGYLAFRHYYRKITDHK